MDRFREQLNNPLVLILLVTIGVAGWSKIFEWWAKAKHHNGIATLFGGRIA